MRRAPREVATFELRKKASWWPERKSMPRLWVCCVLVAWVSSPGGCAENVMSSESGYLMRQHSLAAPYQGRTTYVPTKGVICRSAVYTGTGLEIPYWEFGGASVVTSSYVRLTPDRQSKQGNLWNPVVRLSLHRPSLSLSLSLSLCHLLFFLSLTHTHTHTHTSPSTCLRPNSHFVSTTGRWWSSSVYMVRVRTCLETALLYGTPKTGETSVREEAGVNATPRIVLFPRLVFLLGHFCCHVCVSYLVCRSNIWKFRLFHRSWDFL